MVRLWTTPAANRTTATRQKSPTTAARPPRLPSSDITCPSIASLTVQGNATTAPLYANIVTIARPSRPRYGRAYRTSRTNVRQ